MLVSSLILGIFSIIFIFIPGFGTISFVPSVVGLILGVFELLRPINAMAPRKAKSMSVIIFNWLVLVSIFIWWIGK